MAKNYEFTPLYYGTPCQVRFYDATDKMYRGGIALYDYIICGCCGAVMLINDVVNDAIDDDIDWDDAVVELEWVDISGAIRGE